MTNSNEPQLPAIGSVFQWEGGPTTFTVTHHPGEERPASVENSIGPSLGGRWSDSPDEYDSYSLVSFYNDLARGVIALVPEREVVHIGWDGASNPIYRFKDEMGLPDFLRAAAPAPAK